MNIIIKGCNPTFIKKPSRTINQKPAAWTLRNMDIKHAHVGALNQRARPPCHRRYATQQRSASRPRAAQRLRVTVRAACGRSGQSMGRRPGQLSDPSASCATCRGAVRGLRALAQKPGPFTRSPMVRLPEGVGASTFCADV